MNWGERLDEYFKSAIVALKEDEFIACLKDIYQWGNLYDDDKEMLIAEAVEFFHFTLKRTATLNAIKARLILN